MKELKELELELDSIKRNIKRVENYVKENKGDKYPPHSSHVFGELKHRLTALKVTITNITKTSTRELF